MSADNPVVSIIVPAKNSGTYFAGCIDSVILQKFTDWELLIINDGSSDNTCDIAREYKDRDPRIALYDSTGSGVSAARNCGMDLAKGRYITFIDSDDQLDPEYLSVLVGNADNENADISQCSFYYLFADGRKIKDSEAASGTYSDHKEIMEAYFSGINGSISVAAWGKLFSRELISDIRFDEGLAFHEDAYFTFLACMKATKIICTDEALYYYRQNPESTRGKPFDGIKMQYFTVFDREISACEGSENLIIRIKTRKLFTSLDLMNTIVADNSGREYLETLRSVALKSYDDIKKNGGLGTKVKLKMFLIRHFPSFYYGLLKNKYGHGKKVR